MSALLLSVWLGVSALAQEGVPAEAPVAPAAPVPTVRTWALDAAKSWLYVVAYYDPERWTPITAHDHVIKASAFTGSVTWDPANPSACVIDIQFPLTALAIDPPGGREREKLAADGAVDAETKVTIVKNMLSKMNLFSESFPQISFKSAGCVAGASGKFNVTGDLTIRGATKRITMPLAIGAAGNSFTAKGSLNFNHADFGMEPFTYGPLTPRNKEGIKLVVDVVGS